ncbi:MAG: TIGR02186 family protein [Xanthobacteraceae bacterium]|nr:TIGR02186 family protein [Xanthobacteraceae bacterium]
MFAGRTKAAIAVALLTAPLFVQIAHAERLVTSLSTHRVLISSNFTGTSLVLFASIEESDAPRDKPKKYDIAVTVRGPAATFVARKKDRILGLWVNYESRSYPNVPSYLAVLTNRPAAEFGPLELQTKYKLGLSFAAFTPSIVADEEFRNALVRVKKAEGLFYDEANAVTFLTPTLFRATLPIPATAPIGPYEVDVQVFFNGVLTAQQTTAIEVVKTGFEAFVAHSARENRLDYGLGVAFLAIVVGTLAGLVFRRN